MDHAFAGNHIDHTAEPKHCAFTYLLLSGVCFAYASTPRVLVMTFMMFMIASANVLALALAAFDIRAVAPSKTFMVKWHRKLVSIRHQTPAEIITEADMPLSHL